MQIDKEKAETGTREYYTVFAPIRQLGGPSQKAGQFNKQSGSAGTGPLGEKSVGRFLQDSLRVFVNYAKQILQ